jgi:hypothetical protein
MGVFISVKRLPNVPFLISLATKAAILQSDKEIPPICAGY